MHLVTASEPKSSAGSFELTHARSHLARESIPLVTVALPVFNAGKYLRPAIFSIINQTFENWELLVIDDGSTDTALQEFSDINDARVKIFRDGKNRGLAVRLNEAIEMARGSYFARMDSDDISYPDRFARQLETLQRDSSLDLVATRAITIDEDDNLTGLFPHALSHEEICDRPWRGFFLPHPTWMGKIEWFRRFRYAVPAPYFCEDQEVLLRSYLTSRFSTIDEVLFGYRIKSDVDWNKLRKTRSAICRFQMRYFFNTHRLYPLFYAVMYYTAKVLRDKVLRLIGRRTSYSRLVASETSEELRWQKVRREVSIVNLQR